MSEKREAPWSRGRAVWVVALACVCFATSAPLARVAAPATPLLIAAVRTTLAALFLVALGPRRLLRELAGLTSRQRLHVLGAGLLLAVHFGFFLLGLATTSLPAAVTLVSLEPVAVVLAAWVFFRSRPTPLEGIGVVLATAGAVIVARGAGEGEHRLLGDALVVVAVIVYGLYIAAARGLGVLLSPTTYAASVYAGAAIALAMSAFATGATLAVPTTSWLAMIALAIVPTLGGHTLVQWAARHVRPAVVALVSPGETLGSLAIAAVLMGKTGSAPELTGAAVVVLGVGATIASDYLRR